jgi:dimethylaniline monooxygenase (N-oxide forming)
MYGGACPHVPAHPGKESFSGDVLHSFHFTERTQAAGKRVVVVGGGKSAVDCAVAAVKGGAESVTLLFREAHWPVPRKILDLVPFKFATYSRFGHALLPTHHDVSPVVWWLHALLTPLKWLVWRLVERIFAWQFALTKETTPSSRIEIDVFTGGQILTYEARDMIQSGALKVCKNAIARYTRDGVDLARDGASLPCDMVVYGTGFVKSYDYLDAATRAKLRIQDDGLYLYRSMLPVNVPGLAFLGSEVSTFNNILTHGLQAAWLAHVLAGTVALPPPRQMRQSVEAEMHWKRTWMPATSARAAIQQLHMPKYHDRLVADMGHSTLRKSNPLSELLSPYNARDYRPIFGLPDRTAWMRLKTALALLCTWIILTATGATSVLVAAAACTGVYLLPEEAPLALGGRSFAKHADPLTIVGVAGALYAMSLVGVALVAEM